jgi:hypothetical protein
MTALCLNMFFLLFVKLKNLDTFVTHPNKFTL